MTASFDMLVTLSKHLPAVQPFDLSCDLLAHRDTGGDLFKHSFYVDMFGANPDLPVDGIS